MSQLFADPCRLTRAFAQVVELGSPHVALALDFDAGNERRISLEGSLDAFATRDLAHYERGIEPSVALGDDDAFVGLRALAVAFDDADVHDPGSAGREGRDCLGEPRHFFLFQRIDDVHRIPFVALYRCRRSVPRRGRLMSCAGRLLVRAGGEADRPLRWLRASIAGPPL